MPTFDLEYRLREQGYTAIAGVDEAGRGAWAGPLYAGAVVLDDVGAGVLSGVVKDSKVMTPARRDQAYDLIIAHALSWGVGFSSHEEIDTLGLTRANQLAAERALQQLTQPYDYVLLDGRLKISHSVPIIRPHPAPLLPPERGRIPQQSIIDGDAKCLSIAAASIIAKVSRDRVMREYHTQYPEYGFDTHVGYGTREHQAALSAYGVCPIHRKSYSPIKKLLV